MLYMVIERFRGGDPGPVGERFRAKGRMMPEGVVYLASWLEPRGSGEGRCFQVMEAPDRGALQKWIDCWSDLVEFEVIEVVTSAEYWAGVGGG